MSFWKLLPLTSVLLAAQIPAPMPNAAATHVPGPPGQSAQSGPSARSGQSGQSAQSGPSAQSAQNPALVRATAQAIHYQMLTSSTRIAFKANDLMPTASGTAKVKCKGGTTTIKAKFEHLPEPSSLGPACLTYVLWAVSPAGQCDNLGELQVRKGSCKIKVTEPRPAFALMVSAEPYFAVTRPSTAVILENAPEPGSEGKVEVLEAAFNQVRREGYAGALAPMPALDPKAPEVIHQARLAVAVARAAGAPNYAAAPFAKADLYLHQSEQEAGGPEARILTARSAVQSAEEARGLAVEAKQAERLQIERKLAQEKLTEAQEQAARASIAQDEAVRQAHLIQEENEGLRDKLMAQLSGILETRATARGLIVSMSGVLFKTGQATLTPEAREKLAKVAGILSTHKGIQIEADGFTDSLGPEPLNLKLSESRAQNARDFLVSQGVKPDVIISRGFGEARPIASNETETGRQVNRRVELVVTGEGITGGKAVEP